ncbi:MAG: pentapeptide repeat-containing protein [Oscillospiraceae bacterium]|nr:pentapeptide repeat-containing protein [Oscillospiraceae bacterium]
MKERQLEIDKAVDYLQLNYPDAKANNNKRVGGNAEQIETISGIRLTRTGMKQSKFSYIRYKACLLRNVALTGSQFRNVEFQKTSLQGNSLACCDFHSTKFDGKCCKPFCANNLSISTFEQCTFSDLTFLSSGILNSLFHYCTFSSVVIRGSTLEGSLFSNCAFTDCNFSSLNIEYTQFSRCTFDKVVFPFYQLPYVIGFSDFLADGKSNFTIKAGKKTISAAEYEKQLNRLALYYLDKNEFFPVCNLCIAQGNLSDAERYLLDGVKYALKFRDFRTIRYFCQLALHHGILNEFTRQSILKSMDSFLQEKDVPETQLSYYMSYVGNIRTLLHSRSANIIQLNFRIATNVQRSNPEGIRYVNSLLAELNSAMSQTVGQTGYQLEVANFSPYEIVLNVFSAVGNAASIASLVWMTIDSIKAKNRSRKQTQIDIDTYRQYIATRIDVLRQDLLQLQKKYSRKKFCKYIDEITQQLKTDLEELYDKDIMIFKINNV